MLKAMNARNPRLKYYALFFLGFYVLLTKGLLGSGSSPAAPAPVHNQYAKADGSYSGRANDLEELCKDWVFYRDRAIRLAREGNYQKAQEASASFQQVNVWLGEYSPADIEKACHRPT